MTPSDHRAQCIEAQAKAHYEAKRHINVKYPIPSWDELGPISKAYRLKRMTATFDALYGIARVVPPVATDEMLYIGELAMRNGDGVAQIFASMAKVGDITTPEKKP